jgi:A/G-specific adenine glycosylase
MALNVTDKERIYLQRQISYWGKRNYRDYPWRSTTNIWHALVAEIMLQRTKVDQVVPVYNDFVKRFPDPITYQNHVLLTNENIFKTLGLTWRHNTFQKTVTQIISFGVPNSREALKNIPGIGDYIASAILSFHLGKRESIIDSNIVRFYGRFFGFSFNNETRRKKWFINLVYLLTPKRKFKEYNYFVLDFSMTICSLQPSCSNCILKRKCKYYYNECYKN